MLGECSNKGEFDGGARGNVEVGGEVDRILMVILASHTIK
jgi:hypothetical protein